MSYQRMRNDLRSVRTEQALLLCCARPQTDAEQADRITALVQQELDWKYLLRLAQWHGLLPLLFWHLQATCPEAVPEASWQWLRARCEGNATRNLHLSGELLRLLRLFAAQHILAIPFKGPVLAAALYGDLALRQFADLDILVHPRHVPEAKALLLASGYQATVSLTTKQEAVCLQRYNECAFLPKHGAWSVDLHWSLHPRAWPTPFALEQVSAHLAPVMLGGQEVLTLTPEDTLLLLCMHGTKHLWYQLRWLADVARLLHRYHTLDFDRVLAQAKESTCMLSLGLYLAHHLLEAPLPEAVCRTIQQEPRVPTLAAEAYRLLFRDVQAMPGVLQATWFSLRVLNTLGQRGTFVYDTFFAPTPLEWTLVPLPAALFPLYHLLRPLRLSGKSLLTLSRRLLGSGRAAL